MKSEPSECSVDGRRGGADATVPWVGVRNFQERNFMKNDMAPGDRVLFYHSSCPEPGIAGWRDRVGTVGRPDPIRSKSHT